MVRSRAVNADVILGDLKLEVLQARYQAVRNHLSGHDMVCELNGRFYFYSDAYEFAGTEKEKVELGVEAHALNSLRSIAKRKSELAANGVFADVVCSSEPGFDILALYVEFDERGRHLLKGTK